MKKTIFAITLIALLLGAALAQVKIKGTLKSKGSMKYRAEQCNPVDFDSSATGWFDGAQASFNGIVSEGSAVGDTTTRWQNRLDTAKYFSSGTPSSRPTYHSSGGPNNKPYISWNVDGLAYTNNSASLISTTGYTIVFVIRMPALGNGDYILGSGGYYGIRAHSVNEAIGNKFEHIQFCCNPGIFYQLNSTDLYGLDEWMILEVYKGSGTNYVRINGGTESSVAAANNVQSLLDAPNIGNSGGGQLFDLAGAYFFNTEIGATKRAAFRQCLADSFDLLPDAPNTTDLPSTIASIWEWWEPEREGLNNNDPMNQATGQANSRHMTKASDATRPLFKTNQINGLGAARMEKDANFHYLQIPDMTALTANHTFIVAKLDADPPSSGHGGFHKNTGSAEGFPECHYVFDDSKWYEGWGSANRFTVGHMGLTASSWHVLEIISKSGSYVVKQDGHIMNRRATNTVSFLSGGNAPFGRSSASNWSNGYWAGVYTFSAELGESDRNTIVGYINNRFGLSIHGMLPVELLPVLVLIAIGHWRAKRLRRR